MTQELNALISPIPSDIDHKTGQEEGVIIPLMSEQLEISKRAVQTGVVRLTKHTEQHTQTLDIPLTQVQWQVERVAINQVVQEEPAVRHEGETTIYPVIEERLTVLREIVLVEEVRVTRAAVTTQETSSYVLRHEVLSEERLPVTTELGI